MSGKAHTSILGKRVQGK